MITIRLGVGGILRFRLLDAAGDPVPDLDDADFTVRKYITETDVEGDLSGTITQWRSGCYQITMTGAEADAFGQAWAVFGDGTSEAHVTFMVEPRMSGYARTVVTDTAYGSGFTVAADIGLNETDINGLWAVRRGYEDLAPRKVILFNDTTGAYLVSPSWFPAPTDGDVIDLYRQGNDYSRGGDVSDRLQAQNDAIGAVLESVTWNSGASLSGAALSSTTIEVADLIGYTGESLKGMWLYRDTDRVARLVTDFDAGTGVLTFHPPMADFVPDEGWSFRLGRQWNPYAEGGALSTFATEFETVSGYAIEARNAAQSLAPALLVSSQNPVTVGAGSTATDVVISGDTFTEEAVVGAGLCVVSAANGVSPTVVIVAFDTGTSTAPVSPALPFIPDAGDYLYIMRPQVSLLDHPDGVEPGVSQRIAHRRLLAEAVGESQESGGTVTVRDVNNTRDAFTSDVDASGNRSNFTFDDGV